jgi:hypothetical protein
MKKTEKILDSIWSIILVDAMLSAALFSQGRTAAGMVFAAGTLMIALVAAALGKGIDKEKNI